MTGSGPSVDGDSAAAGGWASPAWAGRDDSNSVIAAVRMTHRKNTVRRGAVMEIMRLTYPTRPRVATVLVT